MVELERRLTTIEVTLREGFAAVTRRLDIANGRVAALETWQREHEVRHAALTSEAARTAGEAAGRQAVEESYATHRRWLLGLSVTAGAAVINLAVTIIAKLR
jgi:uncharacterized membrane protein